MGKPNIYQLIKKPSAKLIDMLVTDVREKKHNVFMGKQRKTINVKMVNKIRK